MFPPGQKVRYSHRITRSAGRRPQAVLLENGMAGEVEHRERRRTVVGSVRDADGYLVRFDARTARERTLWVRAERLVAK